MATKSFKIAKWYVIANYFTIVGCFIIGLFFIIVLVGSGDGFPRVAATFIFVMGICFIVGGIYSISIVPRMKETVQISENQIMHEHPDGTSIAIGWQENFKIRNRPLLGRLELISPDGQRIIKIEQQIDGYKELVEFIIAKQEENNLHHLKLREN
jgi:hypothetical protein